MSADNWAKCPKCDKQVRDEFEELQAKVENEYGKLPKEEYFKLVAKAKGSPCGIDSATLREDYVVGTDEDGVFVINYSCSCKVCGFKFKYIYDEHIIIS